MMNMNKALFLDRDGVINHDPGDYTMSVEEFIILPTVVEALKIAQDKGFLIIVVTNQGGLAKGLYTESEVHAMHQKLRDTCQKSGVEITHIYYSPHHPDFGNSLTRKPESLLLERAIAKYRIDPSKSLMIGDRDRDVECARRVGVKGILIKTNDNLLDHIHQLDQINA
jgi:D-glycero-D-manno-heptose 1,7-bisphosphate phosphatase